MAGKKRVRRKVSPLHHGPSLLVITVGVVLGALVLMLLLDNVVKL